MATESLEWGSMDTDSALTAATRILREQLSRFGVLDADLADSGLVSQQQHLERLNAREPDPRRVTSLSFARITLEEAITLASPNLLDRFLFRFGMYLATVAHRYPQEVEQATIQAAQEVLRALRNPPVERLNRLALRFQDSSTKVRKTAWLQATGLSEDDFKTAVTIVAGKKDFIPGQELDLRGCSTGFPTWLYLPEPGSMNKTVLSTANWLETPYWQNVDLSEPLRAGWIAFVVGSHRKAAISLSPVFEQAGTTWAPTEGSDSNALWAWLRLIVVLDTLVQGKATDPALTALNGLDLLGRTKLYRPDLESALLERVLDSLSWSDVGTAHEAAALTARLSVIIGRRRLTDSLMNEDRAKLRDAWTRRFPYLPIALSKKQTTQSVVGLIDDDLRGVMETALTAARRPKPDPSAQQALDRLRPYLTRMEEGLLDRVIALFPEFRLIYDQPTLPQLGDLTDLERQVEEVALDIRMSGSVLLQETVIPLVQQISGWIEEKRTDLSVSSHPEISLSLETDRLPLSSQKVDSFELTFLVRNRGNTQARNVQLRLGTSDLDLVKPNNTLASLTPGSEGVFTCTVKSGAKRKYASLPVAVTWTDPFEQEFHQDYEFLAEDERPSNWSDDDANPFNLTSLDDPNRLVGRSSDLAVLDGMIRSAQSAYVTGQKRVGKTSLVRVLLKECEKRSWPTVHLPLGRASGDVIQPLVSRLTKSLRRTYPDLEIPDLDVTAEGTGYLIAAGEWFEEIGGLLPEKALVTVAIDDFDELRPQFLTGSMADDLFLFLRTLVDERWLSLILIGSEVLPTIIRAQEHRLNQVAPFIVGNLISREDTKRLVTEPTKKWLEWDERALDRLHYLCDGNPYYETLIAREVWTRMRERDRTFVQVRDIDETSEHIASSAGPAHFSHMWVDDRSGWDPESDRAHNASAVLRAAARCTTDLVDSAPLDEVVAVAQQWVPGAKTADLRVSAANLMRRQVFRFGSEQDRVGIAVPLLARWLRSKGIEHLDEMYEESAIAQASKAIVTARDLVDLSAGLYYCADRVNEIRIKAWLDQIEDLDGRYLAFKLLQRLITEGYFRVDRMQHEAIPDLKKAILMGKAGSVQALAQDGYIKNFFMLDHGRPGSSAPSMTTALLRALKLRKANILTAHQVIERLRGREEMNVLLVVDDFAGTGTQLSTSARTIVESLDSTGSAWRDSTIVVIGAAVSAVDRIAADLPDGVDWYSVVGKRVGQRLHAFSPEAGIFESEDELKRAKDLFGAIGRSLYRDQPFGFGGKGLLVLFENNCPNNTLPAFWRSGHWGGRRWHPLFERQF